MDVREEKKEKNENDDLKRRMEERRIEKIRFNSNCDEVMEIIHSFFSFHCYGTNNESHLCFIPHHLCFII